MNEAGINLELLQSEYSSGQLEFVMQPKYGITTPDNVFILRQAVSPIRYKKKCVGCQKIKFHGGGGRGSSGQMKLVMQPKFGNFTPGNLSCNPDIESLHLIVV